MGDQVFLQAFENATLPFTDWTHEAHLRMAWNYIKDYGPEGATPYIKCVMRFLNLFKNLFFCLLHPLYFI